MAQGTQQQYFADAVTSPPPLRSGTPPLSSYQMPQSSDSDAEPEREVARLTAADTFPHSTRLDEYMASLASRLPHDSARGDSSSARSNSSILARNARRSPSPQPSSSISQQGYSPSEPTASMRGTAAQPNRGDISPRVLEAFGGELSPPHSGACGTLLQPPLGSHFRMSSLSDWHAPRMPAVNDLTIATALCNYPVMCNCSSLPCT